MILVHVIMNDGVMKAGYLNLLWLIAMNPCWLIVESQDSISDSLVIHWNEIMTSKPKTPYPLRLPADLREWAEKQARANDRSLHAELVRLVRHAKEEEQKQATA